MDEKRRFWTSKDRWPRDPQGYTFLARAVHRVGSAFFADEWDGNEPVAPDRYDLSWHHPAGFLRRISQSEVKPSQIRQIRQLLRLPPTSGPFHREKLSDEDWIRGLTLAADADLCSEPARRRLRSVQDYLVQALAAGRLHSVVWDKARIQLESVPALHWAVEDVQQRFFYCAMNTGRPFEVGVWGTNYYPIFLANEGLEAVVRLYSAEANPFIIKKKSLAGAGLMGSAVAVPEAVSSQDIDAVNDSAPSVPSKRRGPKPKYDRSQFLAQVVEKLKDEGGLAPANGSSFRQSHLEDHMRSWCISNWETVPGESTIRDYVVAGIAQYEAGNSGQ